jgi:uncharacterized membrane protein YesL
LDVILIFLIPIICWAFALVLLSSWKHFSKFLIFNIIIVIIYFSINILGKNVFWSHDEYGLATFFRLIVCVIFQTVFVFIFALYKHFNLKNDKKAT